MRFRLTTMDGGRRLLAGLIHAAVSVAAFGQPTEPQPPSEPLTAAGEAADTAKVREADELPKRPPMDLSSPRAAMKSFLVAAQDAAADHPERIDDAVACLDITQLEGGDPTGQARRLAVRLADLIGTIGLDLDKIPESTEETTYRFYPRGNETTRPGDPEVRLDQSNDGTWRFTASTLAAIDTIHDQLGAAATAPSRGSAPDVPVARRSARATVETFLTAMNAHPPDFAKAIRCLNPAEEDAAAWSVVGRDYATKLKNVMDKIREVVLHTIPDDPTAAPFSWYESNLGNIVLARVEEAPDPDSKLPYTIQQGEWLFTPRTLRTIDALYGEFENRDIVSELRQRGVGEALSLGLRLRRAMPLPFRREVGFLELYQWIGLAVLIVLGWPLRILTAAVVRLFAWWSWLRPHQVRIEDSVHGRAFRSIGWISTVVFWWYIVTENHLLLPVGLLAVLVPLTKFGVAVTLVWAGYRIVDVLGEFVASRTDIRLTHFDDVLVPLLRTVLRIVVITLVVLFVLHYWLDKPPTTVLGALGVGGVAVAFSARETLGNFFGSLTVLFDRPFGIGDWIVVGDVEGTVERVGFRSTRVRTFYNSIITIPNAKMVDTHVDNFGARRFRRVRIMLSLTYDTPPDKIDAFCEGIRELIRLHPYTRKDYYHVYFNQYGPSSLDILLYAFFEVPDWGTELRERHLLFLDILRLAKTLGVDFAFPTQTLWLHRANAQSADVEAVPRGKSGPQTPEQEGYREAFRLFEQIYGPPPIYRSAVKIDTKPRTEPRP